MYYVFNLLQLQVVCDHQRKIRDVFIGYPGSVHDSRVFRASPLMESLEEKCGQYYLLGDSGYPCLKHLLTPFRNTGNLGHFQNNFNVKLSQSRYVIEHCFGLLKQKFRQLYHLKLRNINDCVNFIRACCVLHNIAIDDDLPECLTEAIIGDENVQPPLPEDVEDIERDNQDGLGLRNRVSNILLRN